MTNASNRRMTSLARVVGSRAFGRGFTAYRAGEALDPEAYLRTNDQWAYERGRMFAAWYAGALRVNRRLSHGAIVAARDALHRGALI